MSSVCPVVVSYRRPVLVGGISHPLEAEIGDCTPLLELGLLTTVCETVPLNLPIYLPNYLPTKYKNE